MKYDSEQAEKKAALAAAQAMVAAARTAPKGRGMDSLETWILDGEDKDALARAMRDFSQRPGAGFFKRDAANVDAAHCVVLYGAIRGSHGLDCGYCGKASCKEADEEGISCAFAVTDLGIAIGSAVSMAADLRIDNRVMFSIGRTAIEMGLFSKDVNVAFGTPLSVNGKSPFHDRG